MGLRDRRKSLLIACFTLAFTVLLFHVTRSKTQLNVLVMARSNNASLIYKRERSSATGVMNQHVIQAFNLARKATVTEFCQKNNRSNEPVNIKDLKNIVVDEKFRILFCYIPKSACTQWKTVMARVSLDENKFKKNMAYLSRRETRYKFHSARHYNFLTAYPLDEAKRMLKSYYKFVFVREPFERLLSAYLDKFYSSEPGFHKNYGRSIIKKYRPGGNPEDKNVTFDEFVNYVINIGNGYRNEHWQTYDKLCHPCAVEYDFIRKFENLEEEATHVLEKSGLSRKMNVSFPGVKPSSTSSKVPFFYSQIPRERLYKIIQLFGGDSEMFGYDLPKSLRARIAA